MFDTAYKTFLLGIGLAADTKDKIRQQIDEMITKGKLTEQEGRELYEKAADRSRQTRERIHRQVEKWTQETADKMSLVRKSDLAKLEARIEKLEAASKKKSAKKKTKKKSK